MNILTIIEKKKNKQELTKEEIEYVVNGFLKEEIKDYQMSSFLMAVVLNGMTIEETFYLTDVMLKSGDVLDLSSLKGKVVDKHSTGGVGDKTTLIVAPLVASLGVNVVKMSGRGLGHTGGTIDKLEAISGFKTSISKNQMLDQVKKIGVCIASGSASLVPADKKIYALRDVTGTTSSIPLIASSIMSKKIALGANDIVIDLKVGNGALMKDIKDAKLLAHYMIEIGKRYQKNVVCVLTDMNEPLGKAIGNGLEVKESIDVLKNHGDEKLKKLVLTLAGHMVEKGLGISFDEAYQKCQTNLENQKAYQKFEELVKWQGGNIDDICISSNVISLKSPSTGFVNKIDALKLGNLAKILGAGRIKEDDNIDYGVGFVLNKKVGDYVLEGEELVKIYTGKTDLLLEDVVSCFSITNNGVEKESIIIDVIG